MRRRLGGRLPHAAVMPRQPTPTRPCRGLPMRKPTAGGDLVGLEPAQQSASASTFASRERVDATASVVLTSSSSSMAPVCHAGRAAAADSGQCPDASSRMDAWESSWRTCSSPSTASTRRPADARRTPRAVSPSAAGRRRCPMTRPARPSAPRSSRIDALLLGRKTYDIFAAYWPHQSDDIGGTLNRVPKFVVSSTLTDPGWAGTTVLPDAAAAGRLREEYDAGAHVRQRRPHPVTAGGRRARPPPPLALSGHPRAGQAPLRRRDHPRFLPPRRAGAHLPEGRGVAGLRARGRRRDAGHGGAA